MSDIQEQIKLAHKRAEENDYYFKKNNELSSLNTSLRSQRDELQNRINKAIEYINEMCLCSDGYANYGDDLRPEHIVNILQGSDKE